MTSAARPGSRPAQATNLAPATRVISPDWEPSKYQHDQTDLEFLAHAAGITDGTSNTIMFGERAAPPGASGS
jgi:hypothetical protein